MYLGPKYYYQGINSVLLKEPMAAPEAEKFRLIGRAAQAALSKIPSLPVKGLKALPQPDIRLPPATYLKRFVHYEDEDLNRYQVGQVRQEPNFVSTTYWQAPVGQVSQYAERANTVFHIHMLSVKSWGKYVDSIKRAAREGEVLFPPGTPFRVIQRAVKDYPLDVPGVHRRQMHIIQLKEVKHDAHER